jgi:hypothetical protein
MMKVREQIDYHEKCTKRKYIWELKEKSNIQENYQMIQIFTFSPGVEENDND